MSEWIKVKNKLPIKLENYSFSDSVLISFRLKCDKCNHSISTNFHAIGYYSYKDEEDESYFRGEWLLNEPLEVDYFPSNYSELIEVTHWMPLPLLPEVGE